MELLERGSVLLELSRLLGEAVEGQGRVVFLGGEAGVGKTALVRRFGELARDHAALLVGACDPLSTPRPLAPLLDVVDRLPGATPRVEEGKDLLFRDVLRSLAASRRPLVLVFEDVHWADEATLDLLRFLARRAGDLPVLLVATFRNDEVGDRHPLRVVLGDVATASAVRRLALHPLSAPAVRALAAGSGLDPDELLRRTGGNPFFLTEVLAAGGERIPHSVRDAVLARAARLPPAARAVLDAAAVIGRRSEPWLLREVAGAEPEAMEACTGSGVLAVEGDVYAFRHELAREAVLGALPPGRRAELNRRVLAALRRAEGGEADPARLVDHAEAAGDGTAVLELALAAARRASALSAHRQATDQYARALRFADGLPPGERAEILDEYARECAASDLYDEAIRAALERVEHWRGVGDRFREAVALGFLSGCLLSHGRGREAEEPSRRSLALLEAFPPGPELAEAHVRRARVRLDRLEHDAAARAARRALSLADAGDFLRTRILAYNRLGTAALLGGDPEGERDLERSLELAREAGIHLEAAGALESLGCIWLEQHDFARAERCLVEGIALAEEFQLQGYLTPMLAERALVRLRLGAWAEAEALAHRVLDLPRVSAVSRMLALLALGRLNVRRGRPAAEILDEALALAEPTGALRYLAPVRAARAELAWLRGEPERVRAEAGAALDEALARRQPWIVGELSEWLRRAGESVELPAYVPPPFALQAAGRMAEAAEAWRARGCGYEAAEASAETGGTAELRAALAEFQRLGARPAATRVLQRLRERGVRGIPRGPRPSTRTHPAGLTRREAEIAALLSEGLRNGEIARRLFLSPKTVDHHVSRVLAKLGVRSRGEAGRAAERLGLRQSGEPDPST